MGARQVFFERVEGILGLVHLFKFVGTPEGLKEMESFLGGAENTFPMAAILPARRCTSSM